MQSKFGVDDVLGAMLDLEKDRTNAIMYEGTPNEACVYTNSRGEHCIVGQIFLNLGLELPSVESLDNRQGAVVVIQDMKYPFEPDAAFLLSDLQSEADGVGEADGQRKWGEAINNVLSSILENNIILGESLKESPNFARVAGMYDINLEEL